MSFQVTYNERSWAIDLISEINLWLKSRDIIIKRAGGENSIQTNEGVRFPDVLIYGDQSSGLILQGWELKMPDTAINDTVLLDNAAKKAEALNLNSFIVWNVKEAALYIIEGSSYRQIKNWVIPVQLNSRSEVQANKSAISKMLESVLLDLNTFFNDGVIKSSTYTDSLTGDGISNVLLSNLGLYAEELESRGNENYQFEDEVNLWWLASKFEYPDENNKWKVLARNNLVTLFNKFIFAHTLKHFNKSANLVDHITKDKSPEEAIDIFQSISEKADFWNVFSKNLGEEFIPKKSWSDYLQLNSLLRDLSIESIDTHLIYGLIDSLVARSKRKVAGQFATPRSLANLFAKLVVHDAHKHTYDPCCGTGTIAKAIYDLKIKKGIQEPLETLWASDKFALPLRIAMLNLTKTDNIGKILKVFKEDVLELEVGRKILLHDPFDGSKITEHLPPISYIASNLPFVQQEDASKLNKNIDKINRIIAKKTGDNDLGLGSRSDLYAYIPFSLWSVLEDNGRLGIIISNSWLGTEMGEKFFGALSRFYNIEAVITSGKGRWFKNAKVVTNILLLNKNPDPKKQISQKIKFVTLNKDIEEIDKNDDGSAIKSIINVGERDYADLADVRSYSSSELEYLKLLLLPKSSYFADLSWIKKIESKTVKINALYNVNRGERRGWDPLFYPDDSAEIEPYYLKPVVKSPRTITSLEAGADGVAFCCDVNLEELSHKGHTGALKWIKSFEHITNNNGKPLPDVLKRSGMQWYTMKAESLADLTIAMNPGDRLFVAKLDEPTFVNQRLIRFTKKDPLVNNELVHALMNSILGMFYIEALGFGRGEGVLDLNSKKISQSLRILNPGLISAQEALILLNKFNKLKKRNIRSIREECESPDRKDFDLAVLAAFGLENIYGKIKESLLSLYQIRTSVKD